MLSATQIEEFHRRGCLVVEDIVPAVVRDAVESEYAALIREMAEGLGLGWRGNFLETLRAVHLAGHDWFQPLDITLPGSRIEADTPFHYGPAVHDLICNEALLDLAEAIVGPRITSNPIQHLRIKPPSETVAADAPVHTTVTAWHQDRAVAHAEADATDIVTVWVAMTDATPENGCLIAQPFDGPQAMLPHCPLDQTAIPSGYLTPARAEPLPVRAGGVVLLHPMVPHAALDNRTDGFRWSFDLRYQHTGQPTGRAHFPSFPVRPGPAPDWRAVREMWLDARAACAQVPHIPIHRWTSDSPNCA
ncbi:phytanoyl-CoA dioxygenase family protein [Jannaschia seohaensis]|uniref:Phytanoyl-CoA dioxygenase (PhyH) n=1 Tax=Jannaschia seohaensis TaxID=475081 RepID=A0A2Y9ARD9_9RHOB|nr:phytanoyl-CoA dioxygenase family protein [Jannaschia seohaensis]PWJ19226.1 phytanoyl-CoA dioxygenase PhyH [Jannaschia seohaensis]SSA45888.1 Phytanoyl-CoA dioxygenase (PhyH) [Jannaschia seohaensis]